MVSDRRRYYRCNLIWYWVERHRKFGSEKKSALYLNWRYEISIHLYLCKVSSQPIGYVIRCIHLNITVLRLKQILHDWGVIAERIFCFFFFFILSAFSFSYFNLVVRLFNRIRIQCWLVELNRIRVCLWWPFFPMLQKPLFFFGQLKPLCDGVFFFWVKFLSIKCQRSPLLILVHN